MTNENRLLLINQFKLLAIHDLENKQEYEENIQTLQQGYITDYVTLFGELMEETPTEITNEVGEIITMYRYIRNAKMAIGDLEVEHHHELLDKIKFRGFDGNHDKHYHYFKHLVESPDEYDDINNWPTNCHSQSDLGRYRRMLTVFNQITMKEHNYNNWGLPELIRLGEAV